MKKPYRLPWIFLISSFFLWLMIFALSKVGLMAYDHPWVEVTLLVASTISWMVSAMVRRPEKVEAAYITAWLLNGFPLLYIWCLVGPFLVV